MSQAEPVSGETLAPFDEAVTDLSRLVAQMETQLQTDRAYLKLVSGRAGASGPAPADGRTDVSSEPEALARISELGADLERRQRAAVGVIDASLERLRRTPAIGATGDIPGDSLPVPSSPAPSPGTVLDRPTSGLDLVPDRRRRVGLLCFVLGVILILAGMIAAWV
jgi:hypothetical protein